MDYKWSALLLAVLLIMGYTITYSIASHEFNIDSGVNITLPEDWDIIPDEIIEEVMNNLLKESNIEIPKYDYGFQKDTTNGYFIFPYFLVQINNGKRVPESEIESLNELTDAFNTSAKEQDFAGLITNISVGDFYYDSTGKRIIGVTETTSNDAKLKGINVIQLTQNGYINLYFYSLEPDFNQYDEEFFQIINNIHVDSPYEYKYNGANIIANKGERTAVFDFDQIFSKALSGGISALIIVGIAYAYKSIRKFKH